MKNTDHDVNLTTIVPETLAGQRLDRVLAVLFSQFSRARLQTWIRNQQVLVDGQPKRPRDSVTGGETITIIATLENKTEWLGQPLALNIIYEDTELLVINKPVGLVVHPAAGNPDSTLVNALLYHCPDLAKLPRAGIIHRLDKHTSGLLVIGKNLTAYTELARQLKARSIEREYSGIINGTIVAGGTIDAPIGRHPIQRKHMAVVASGKAARTHYRIIERFRNHTWLRINLETGRTHQIRVHLTHIHHPLVGDQTYGGGRIFLPKAASPELIAALRQFKHQALHAQRLALCHPLTQEHIEWQAPLPDDFLHLIKLLRDDYEKNSAKTKKSY